MCTLLTVAKATFQANPRAIVERIQRDWIDNPDGYSLLILDELGQWTQLRGFAIDLAIDALYALDWQRIWLHQRWATQGEVNLDNCHGWSYRGYITMHNGALTAADAQRLPVDSMALGRWLLAGTLARRLESEAFANVFVIDTNAGGYAVHRSLAGSLHTNGRGDYSTEPIPGVIDLPVVPGWESYVEELPVRPLSRRFA